MHITIIEDEKILSKNISKKLNKNGFNTQIFNSYNDFINANSFITDLYIIDISLIDGSGFDIIKKLREGKNTESPIIITSGYSDPEKKIYGLDLGADDYLAKPFSAEELIARVRALLRRSYKVAIKSTIKYRDIVYDSKNKTITKNGLKLKFTFREIQFIEYMLFNIGNLVDKEDLILSVWGEHDSFNITDNNINVVLSRVRKKLGDSFKLKTIVNQGYILEK